MSEPVSWHVYRRPGMSRRSAKPDGRIYGPEPWAVVRGVELSHWDLWFVVVMSSLSGGKRELVELLKSRRHDVEAKLSHLLDLESRLIAGGVSHADVLQGVTVDRALLRKAGDKVIEQSAWRPTQAMIDTPRKLLRDRAMRGHWPKFLVEPATCERAFDRFCRPEGDYGWRFTPLLAHTVERTWGDGRHVEHRLEQRDVVGDGLGAQLVLLVDVVVGVLGPDVHHPHFSEEGTEVRPNDAHVVLLAPLVQGALVEPVVEQLVAGLVGVELGQAASADVGGLGLVPRKLDLGRAELVEDRALALAARVAPADAPLVAMSNGLGHGVRDPFPRRGPPRPCKPERRVAAAAAVGSHWPTLGPRNEKAESPVGANSAFSLGCAGAIRGPYHDIKPRLGVRLGRA